jgi:hypothetical protein
MKQNKIPETNCATPLGRLAMMRSIRDEILEVESGFRDLYEALENRRKFDSREPPPYGHDCKWCVECCNRMINDCDAALKKARGER